MKTHIEQPYGVDSCSCVLVLIVKLSTSPCLVSSAGCFDIDVNKGNIPYNYLTIFPLQLASKNSQLISRMSLIPVLETGVLMRPMFFILKVGESSNATMGRSGTLELRSSVIHGNMSKPLYVSGLNT